MNVFFPLFIKIYKYINALLSTMEVGEKITITRKTFRYGNSIAVVIPAQFKIPDGTPLKLTVERLEQ